MVKNEFAGYATFTFDFSTWDAKYYLHLNCIYIKKKFRGLGMGKAMMERLVDVAKKNNCINLQWQTPVFNEMAIRFYEESAVRRTTKNDFSFLLNGPTFFYFLHNSFRTNDHYYVNSICRNHYVPGRLRCWRRYYNAATNGLRWHPSS